MLPVSSSIRSTWTAVLACLLLAFGCYSPDRDLIQDPFNTPLIHILDSRFDASTGAVTIRWEYLGSAVPDRVVILRRVDLGFDSIGVIRDPVSVGTGRIVDSFVDPSPPAGELLEYAVQGVTPLRRVDARAVQVQIPGARLLRLRRNPFQGRIQVDWEAAGSNLTSFEIVRSVAGEETTIAVIDGDERSFVDTSILGNTVYGYRVFSVVANGLPLKSGSLTTQVYSLERTEKVGAAGERLVISSGSSASSATMLALKASSGDAEVSKYRYFFASFGGNQTIGAIREETVDTRLVDVDHASLTVAGPSVFAPATANERAFVAGRNVAGTRVEIRGFSLPNLTSVWDGPQGWTLTDPSARISAVQGGDGNFYFSAGRSLRVFSTTLFQIQNYALPFGEPSDLDADSEWLWAVIPTENRIVRTDISSGLGTTPTWEDVELSRPISPIAMTLNRFGQIFLLDGSTHTIHVFDADLTPLTTWILPNEDFAQGGITLDGGTGNLVHVSSSNGTVYTYLP